MSTTKKPTLPANTDTVAKLAELADRARALTEDAEKLAQQIALEQQVRHARGTKRDMKPVGTPIVARPSVTESELYAQIRTMLTARPMTLRDIIAETKAEDNKVKVVLLAMQRGDAGLINMGNQYRALWFIPDAKLLERLRGK